jgi:hypothetical protein
LPVPPSLRVVAAYVVALVQPLRAQLFDSAGGVVELIAVATVELPVVPQVTASRLGINDNEIAQRATVSIAVGAESDLRPRDASSLESFESHIRPDLSLAIGQTLRKVARPPAFDVPGGFDESRLRIFAPALWLSSWNQVDVLTVGAQVEPASAAESPRDPPPPDRLAPFANLSPPDTISIIATESLVERGLRAVVASGQLTRLRPRTKSRLVPRMNSDRTYEGPSCQRSRGHVSSVRFAGVRPPSVPGLSMNEAEQAVAGGTSRTAPSRKTCVLCISGHPTSPGGPLGCPLES